MALIFLSCAWVAGIFAGLDRPIPGLLVLSALLPLPLVAVMPRRRKMIVLASLGLLAFFAAAVYAYATEHNIDDTMLRAYNDRSISVRGIVAGDPEPGDRRITLKVAVSEVESGSGWRPVRGTAVASVPRYPEYRYGDELLLRGRLAAPVREGDFDYPAFLAHQGIYSVMSFPQVQLTASDRGSKPLALVCILLREGMAQVLHRVLPEPQSALAEGIVLGRRGMIPPSLSADFSRSGTAHILAISGANLTIVAGIMVALGVWLFGRRHYLYVWIALGMVWVYTVLTGLNPPVVRAAIMASLFLAAELLGRQRHGVTALTSSAAAMVGVSPYILGDVSFRMSFLAMAGLVLFYSPLSAAGHVLSDRIATEWLSRLAARLGDGLAASLSPLLGVWPLIAYYFGIVSLSGPVATLLVLPVLPGIIFSGILAGLAGMVFLPLAQAIGWVTWLMVSYMVLLVTAAAALPYSFLKVGGISMGAVSAYYLALALAVWLRGRGHSLRSLAGRLGPALAPARRLWQPQIVLPPLVVAAGLLSVSAAALPDSRLHVYFLDVGEGDAVLVQKGSQQVLIDGGPGGAALMRGLGSRMAFWDRNIELVASSHPHADHLSGLVEVLRRYGVGTVLDTPGEYRSALSEEWERAIREKGLRRVPARTGETVNLGDGAAISVLNPGPRPFHGTESDPDNNGVVLRLSLGQMSFLFTGDIMQSAENELVHSVPGLASTVLKVAHHGSSTSTTAEFLAAVSPRVAVISVGAGNEYGHPHSEVVQRLSARLGAANVYRTDRQGTIEFITDGKGLWMKAER